MSLKDHPSIKSLIEYFLSKANSNVALCTVLEDILAPPSKAHVGLILSERLVNMPVQVIPPMYRMLADEIKWAVEEVAPSPLTQPNLLLTHPRSGRTLQFQVLPRLITHLPSSPRGTGKIGTKFQPLKAQKGPNKCNRSPPFFPSRRRAIPTGGDTASLCDIFRSARDVGIDAFHPLSIYERSTKRGRRIWA